MLILIELQRAVLILLCNPQYFRLLKLLNLEPVLRKDFLGCLISNIGPDLGQIQQN